MKFNNSSPEYLAYLRSQKWLRLRNLVLQRDRGLCRGCLQNMATEVHHLNYDRVYEELAFDLISLCEDCHDRAHGRQVGKRKVQPAPLLKHLERYEANMAAKNKQENGGLDHWRGQPEEPPTAA
jgi:5-methylcytosine-specific restriction endonuclease McrA